MLGHETKRSLQPPRNHLLPAALPPNQNNRQESEFQAGKHPIRRGIAPDMSAAANYFLRLSAARTASRSGKRAKLPTKFGTPVLRLPRHGLLRLFGVNIGKTAG